MKKQVLALAFLGFLPVTAQSWEVGAFVGQQPFRSGQVTSGTFSAAFDAKDATTYSVRAAYTFSRSGAESLQVTAASLPSQTIHVPVHTRDTSGPIANDWSLPLDYSSLALGASFTHHAVLDVCLGLEARLEKLNGGEGALFLRPWGRAAVTYTLPLASRTRPFAGIEAAYALTAQSSFDGNTFSENNLRALAARRQVGVYAGVRF